MAQALAHSSTGESGQQETISRYQYIPSRARRIRFAVLAHLPSGASAWRKRSTRRARHQIVFWKFNEYETETADGETENRTSAFLRYYTVFNLEQTEGLKALLALPPARPIESAEAIIAGMPNPPAYQQGFLACYSPSNDTVTMPSPTAFHSHAEYYSTMFHELAHATGHAKRLAQGRIRQAAGIRKRILLARGIGGGNG